jgi:hypothetical protein
MQKKSPSHATTRKYLPWQAKQQISSQMFDNDLPKWALLESSIAAQSNFAAHTKS